MVPGPTELRYLDDCELPLLEEEEREGPTISLWLSAYLAGMMGSGGSRTVRTSDTLRAIQLTSNMVSQQLAVLFGCATNRAKEVNLNEILNDIYFPALLAAPLASETELRREARDACQYRQLDQVQLDVEISRLPLLRSR